MTWQVAFGGSGVSGALTIDFTANPKTGPLGTSPNTVDPVGSFIVKNVAGTFTDTKLRLTNIAVTGIVPVSPTAPEASNKLAPASFSLFPVKNGVSDGGVSSPGFHYDNLLYPGGSPQTASDYPNKGGYLDIYGLMFTLANKDAVNLWSNGSFGGPSADYGIAVTDGISSLDYAGGVSLSVVPLLASAPMFGAALLALAGFGYALNRWVAPKGGMATA